MTKITSEIDDGDQLSSEQALSVYMAEYKCLRAEIEWLISDGTKYQTFAITLLGVLLTGFGWIVKEAPDLLIPALLVVPFIFSLLGFSYCRQHEEVYVVAAYLKDYLRPRVRKLVGDPDLWGWEEFKAERSDALRTSKRFKRFSLGEIIFLLRGMLFVAPSAAALCVTAVVAYRTAGPNHFVHIYGWTLTVVMGLSFLIDSVILAVFVRHLVKGRELPIRVLKLEPRGTPRKTAPHAEGRR